MYQKGDIVFVNFPYSDGSKFKPRPAIVLSGSKVNRTGDYILIQITSNVSRTDGLSLPINLRDVRHGPMEKASVVRVHKLFTADESLILAKLGAITLSFRRKVNARLNATIR